MVAALSPGLIRATALVGAACAVAALAVPAALAHLAGIAGQPGGAAVAAGVPVVAAVWAWLVLRERWDAVARPTPAWRAIGLAGCGGCAVALFGALAAGIPGGTWLCLLLAPVAACLCLLIGGPALLRLLAGPVLLLLLAWPVLPAAVDRLLSPPLVAIAAWAGLVAAPWFGVTVTPVPDQSGAVWCHGPAGVQALLLGDPCSGSAALLALALLAVPVLALARPGWRVAVCWLGLGLAAVVLLNAARIAALCAIAGHHGIDAAFAAFHLVAGPLSWLAVWAVLLVLARLLRLQPRRDPPPGPVGRGPAWAGLALAAPILALGGAASWLLPDPVGGPPRRTAAAVVPVPVQRVVPQQIATLLPEVAQPAQRWHHSSFGWAGQLFGAGSRFERFAYPAADGGRIRWVDVVLAQRLDDLERHGVEACYRWHSFDLDVRGTCLLGRDLVGERFVVIDDRQRRWAAVTWTQPVLAEGTTWWRRTTIQQRIADEADAPAAVADIAALARSLAAPQPAEGVPAAGVAPAAGAVVGSR